VTYCPNCGKQNTSLLKNPNGRLYQLEDDLNRWSNVPNKDPTETFIVTYTTFLCGDCGNLFAVGEADVNQEKKN